MTLDDCIRLRDRMIKTELLGMILPEHRKEMEEIFDIAFTKATELFLTEDLPILVGADNAEKIATIIKTREVQ